MIAIGGRRHYGPEFALVSATRMVRACKSRPVTLLFSAGALSHSACGAVFHPRCAAHLCLFTTTTTTTTTTTAAAPSSLFTSPPASLPRSPLTSSRRWRSSATTRACRHGWRWRLVRRASRPRARARASPGRRTTGTAWTSVCVRVLQPRERAWRRAVLRGTRCATTARPASSSLPRMCRLRRRSLRR